MMIYYVISITIFMPIWVIEGILKYHKITLFFLQKLKIRLDCPDLQLVSPFLSGNPAEMHLIKISETDTLQLEL